MEAHVNSQVLPLRFANIEKVFARLPNSLRMPQKGFSTKVDLQSNGYTGTPKLT